jgi:large subunit ribosomal protein L6
MSRIGKQPVPVPAGIAVKTEGDGIAVEGPKGSLELTVSGGITFDFNESSREMVFSRPDDTRSSKSLHGLYRSLFNNMVEGVSRGYSKTLLIEGVGYRGVINGKKLELSLGYSDPKILDIPEGITVEAPQATRLIVTGADKQKVGQFAALIRRQRPPEPYKGKGVMYDGEVIRRKAGKTFVGEEG